MASFNITKSVDRVKRNKPVIIYLPDHGSNQSSYYQYMDLNIYAKNKTNETNYNNLGIVGNFVDWRGSGNVREVILTFEEVGTYDIYFEGAVSGTVYQSNIVTIEVYTVYNKKLIIKNNNDSLTLLDENLIQEKLDEKLDTSDAFSGSYTDLTNKPTIPSASSSNPSADVSGGAIGLSGNYAKADHQHPLSSAYATATHNQASTTITDMDVVQVVVTYTDDTTETLNLFKKVIS